MSSGGNPFDFSQYNGASSQSTPLGNDAATGFSSPSSPSGFDTGGFDAFSGSGTSAAPVSMSVVSAPLLWAYLAAGCAVIGIVLGLALGGAPAMAIAGWAIGGPAAIALLSVFSLKDTRARASAMYSASDAATWLYRGVLFLSLVAIVIGALRIANWIGRI